MKKRDFTVIVDSPLSSFDISKIVITLESLIKEGIDLDGGRRCLEWCAKHRLIANSMDCQLCGVPMKFQAWKNSVEGFGWGCPRITCRGNRSIKTGSCFNQSKVPIWTAVQLLHLWTNGSSLSEVHSELQINFSSLVDQFKITREICTRYVNDWRMPIGGEGEYVEIDATLCHSASETVKQWVFGGVQRDNSKNMFLVALPNQSTETLLSAITENIAPGSTIISKQLAAYDDISQLEGYNYTHLTVDPLNPATHIDNIVSIWDELKKMYGRVHRAKPVDTNEHFAPYLNQFLFTHHYPFPSTFGNLLYWIGFYYPL